MTSKLIVTGGTIFMGYEGESLVPMYDVRYAALATKIIDSKIEESDKKRFLDQLVNSKDLILKHGVGSVQVYRFIKGIIAQLNTHTQEQNSLKTIVEGCGLSLDVEQPYTIDSINFSFDEHYAKLRDSIMEKLRKGESAIVIGGTDTLEFYAKAFAEDPTYQSFRLDNPQNENNVVFASSMLSYGDDPEHVAKILKSATIAAENIKPVGAFALSAKDKEVSAVTVHGLRQNFVKISSRLADAFRSPHPVGKIKDGRFIKSSTYRPKANSRAGSPMGTNKVAPPLIDGNRINVAKEYLEHFPNHAVIIEGGLKHRSKNISSQEIKERNELSNIIAAREKRGVLTYFVDDQKFDYKRNMFPIAMGFVKFISSPFVGGKTETRLTTIGVYIKALFGKDTKESSIREIEDKPTAQKVIVPGKSIGIRYVPDAKAFEEALSVVREMGVEKLYIRALPGESLPARHVEALEKLSESGVTIFTGFKYADRVYKENGTEFTEGANEVHYAASKGVRSFVTSLGTRTPSEALAI